MESHAANFPHVDHYCEDITKLDLAKFPGCDIAHHSPACPAFTDARGEKQHFDADTQGVLFEDELGHVLRDDVRQGRVLMNEVPRYLEAMALRGKPVLCGTVENVTQARKWGSWQPWLRRIQNAGPGYNTVVLAVNSAHLYPVNAPWPPQSRNRLLVWYGLKSFGRVPDFDKWLLRPRAYCHNCAQWVRAMRVWKKPGTDMGSYGIRHGQYFYRCPHRSCRGQAIEPQTRPAIDIIDWTLPAQRIGERVDAKGRPDPLEPATLARIQAGISKHYAAMLSPAGGTWRDSAIPLSDPMPARTTRETDAVAWTDDFDRKVYAFLMRNNGSRGDGGEHCTPVTEPARTITTKGHQSVVMWDLMVPYYSHGNAHPSDRPIGALTTKDRYAIAYDSAPPADVMQARARMMGIGEIKGGMGFTPDYILRGNGKQQVRQLGQAVTPVVAELALYAEVEMLSGESFDPAPWTPPEAIPPAPAPVPKSVRKAAGQTSLFDAEAA